MTDSTSDIPAGLKYSNTHEWVQHNEDGTVSIGITDHAQSLLGDLVYVELPEPSAQLNVGDECGVVESVKSASDLIAPIAGEVVEVNETLINTPEQVNQSPYDTGWLYKVKPGDAADIDKLLDDKEYAELISSE